MKWQTKREPHVGDTRVRKIFAFLPHRCQDGHTYWLEYIYFREKFVEEYDGFCYTQRWKPDTYRKTPMCSISKETTDAAL